MHNECMKFTENYHHKQLLKSIDNSGEVQERKRKMLMMQEEMLRNIRNDKVPAKLERRNP